MTDISEIIELLEQEKDQYLATAKETTKLDHNSFGSGFDQGMAEGVQRAIEIIKDEYLIED